LGGNGSTERVDLGVPARKVLSSLHVPVLKQKSVQSTYRAFNEVSWPNFDGIVPLSSLLFSNLLSNVTLRISRGCQRK